MLFATITTFFDGKVQLPYLICQRTLTLHLESLRSLRGYAKYGLNRNVFTHFSCLETVICDLLFSKVCRVVSS